MKVIVIDHEPFSDRKMKHYYFAHFQQENIEIQYWDVSGLVAYSKNVHYLHKKESPFVREYTCFETLYKDIGLLDASNTIVILEVFFRPSTVMLFKTLRNQGIRWCRINYYQNPTAVLGDRPSFMQRVMKIFDMKSLKQKLVTFGNSQYVQPDLLFVTGSRNTDQGGKVISIDYFDVEEYKDLLNEHTKPLASTPYIVFLDIMFANHPDFKRLGVTTISSTIYFQKMRDFFDKLEERFNMPVVVASHPKANYSSEYGERLILKDVTAQLVKDSYLVVTHGSLSISHALLSSKPILYVYLEEMRFGKFLPVYFRRMVRGCESLSAQLVSTTDELRTLHLDVDEKKYNQFLQEVYLKPNEEKRSNFMIIKDSICSLILK